MLSKYSDAYISGFTHCDSEMMQLPVAADLLGTHQDNVEVICPPFLGREFLLTLHSMKSDRLHHRGLIPEAPFIYRTAHSKCSDGAHPFMGMRLYRSRESGKLYVVSMRYDGSVFNDYIFCCKGDVFSIMRQWYRTSQQGDGSNNPPPFLEDGVAHNVISHSIDLIKNRRRLKGYNIRPVYGMLLSGEPGNGKTMLCRHLRTLASQAKIRTETITASELDDAYSKDRIEPLFYGSTDADCILFFDDIDISYLSRTSGNGKVACSILSAMDGISPAKTSVIRIFTINEDTHSLDPAFIRPGRIDQTIEFVAPSTALRRKFIQSWHHDIIENIDAEQLVRHTEGQSFASVDSIKTALVLHHLDHGEWNLEVVMGTTYHETKKPVGFGG